MIDRAPAEREAKYSVAVRDAQYEYLNGQEITPLPAPSESETRRLEGPPQREAA